MLAMPRVATSSLAPPDPWLLQDEKPMVRIGHGRPAGHQGCDFVAAWSNDDIVADLPIPCPAKTPTARQQKLLELRRIPP